MKNIFLFLFIGRKLKLLSYNKSLQRKLNIDIIDYKRLSERYIIFGNNGKGKEYNGLKGNLIFEGEYLKGKRNGKGIEYNNEGGITFEGEYLSGKRSGFGIEYQINYGDNLIIYEGGYLNGKRNGKGKEYDEEGRLVFYGIFLNGERWKGKIKEYYKECVILIIMEN